MTTPPRILTWFASVVFFVVCLRAYALPPVGLTQLRAVEDESARIAVIGDTGYISTRDGIQPINQGGLLPLVTPLAPTFGPLIKTTRVISDSNGELFYGAKFDKVGINIGRHGGLYSLEDPSIPAITWPGGSSLIGFDSTLKGYTDFSVLLPDGSEVSPIPYASDDISQFFAGDVTPKGTVLGSGAIPGTIGEAAALLYTDGSAEFIGGPVGTSIRDRLDGDGVNVGVVSDGSTVRYGSLPNIQIRESTTGSCCDADAVIVSESDFAVVNLQLPRRHTVYYPDVNPAGTDLSVPLLDFFPELQSLDFDLVVDATSVGGQIHLLLSGDDGLWLFAAPDPTVVPEPATVTLFGMLTGILVLRRRQIGAA